MRGFRFRSSLKKWPARKAFFSRRRRSCLRPTKLLVTREKKSLVPRVWIDCLWQGGWSNDDDDGGRESVRKKFILRENRSLRHHAIWNCCLVRFCDDHSRKIRPHLKNWAVTNKPDRVWKDANSSFWGFFCSPHGIVVVAWASFVLRHLEEGDLLRASFDNLRDVRDQRGRIGHRALIRITRITRTQRSSIVGIAKAPFWDRNIDKLLWCAGVVSWNL